MADTTGETHSRWQRWLNDGRIATVAWFLVFIAYVGFRVANVNAPEITNAFVTITGIWVGNLGIAQGKKVAKVEEKAVIAKEKADVIEQRVDALSEVAETHHPGEQAESKAHAESERDKDAK